MGSGSIVKTHVFLQYIVEMMLGKDEYVIQAFLSDGTYPTFSKAVGLWGSKWCADNLYSRGVKHM